MLGVTPIITIDKCDGVQLFLSEQSKSAEIVSAKSSEMNVMVPKGDGDFVSLVCKPQLYLLKVYVRR